jgi:penicillin-binding protein-related factor A (putative recombinase)
VKESQLNTIINNNLKGEGFSHKISDFREGAGVQNPFDGFSVFAGRSWYWETKLLRGYRAFNFKEIKPHQLENLTVIKLNNICAECLVIVGVFCPYKFLDLLLFDIDYINFHISVGKKSVLKYQLLRYKEQNCYIPIKKKFFNVDLISKKIIRIGKGYEKVY